MATQLGALFALFLLLDPATSQAATTVVTATTTITAAESGACNHFVGACVVYGAPGAPPYTTTVYAGASESPGTVRTSTTTVSVSASDDAAAGASACSNFEGACVVYGAGSEGASYTTTLFNGNNQPQAQATLGNGDGYIGPAPGSDGYIGGAASLSMGVILPLVSFLLVNVGFFVWM